MDVSVPDPQQLSPRARRMLRARRELASTAVRLFLERGFAQTTVDDIAEAADYSASTFFRQFGSKEDAVFFDVMDRMKTYEALRALNDGRGPTWPQIRAVLLENAAYWEDADPAFAKARTELFLREPVLYRRYLIICDQIESLLRQALVLMRGTSANTDVWCEVVAAAAVGAWRAGFAKWLGTGGRLEDHIAAGLDVLDPVVKRGRSRTRHR